MSEDIIRMAREAGAWSQQKKNCQVEYVMSGETVKHFAALVAAAEREACAKLADDIDPVWESVSVAIRARGNT